MLSLSPAFPAYQFIVAKAPGLEESFYDELMKGYDNVSYVSDKTYDLLRQSKAALVTSGTATLETALFAIPEVVCYKGSPISYEIAKRVIKVKYISLVNLIMDKPVVKELIQHDLNAENLHRELNDVLNNAARRAQLDNDYADLRKILGEGGNASYKAALSIVNYLRKG